MLNCLKVPVSVVTGTLEQGTRTPRIWAGAGELRQLDPIVLIVAEGRPVSCLLASALFASKKEKEKLILEDNGGCLLLSCTLSPPFECLLIPV